MALFNFLSKEIKAELTLNLNLSDTGNIAYWAHFIACIMAKNNELPYLTVKGYTQGEWRSFTSLGTKL